MAFKFEAIDPAGKTLIDTINAGSPREAADLLRDRGLFVTKIELTADDLKAEADSPRTAAKAGGSLKDVVFFTQQMSMLMRSGARVVQALEAIEEQGVRSRWQAVIRSIRHEVEEGRPLSAAMRRFPKLFPEVYTNMITAGEASGDIGLAFERLARIIKQQQEIRTRVLSAVSYPAVLLLLCIGVVAGMFTFVVPRFAEMFASLDVDLPPSTAILMALSEWSRSHWYIVIIGTVAASCGIVFFFRSAAGKRCFSRATVRIPVFGRVVRNVILARACRIWGQLLESKVGLLETVELTQRSTRSLDFQELFMNLADAITDGNSIGPCLRRSWLIPNTFTAAIVTGESSGKLAPALIFVADVLDEENTQVLNSLTRLIEPVILVIMGVVVGGVAISLFLPMFDMATVAGQ